MHHSSRHPTSLERSNHHSHPQKRAMGRRPNQYQTNHSPRNHPEDPHQNPNQSHLRNLQPAQHSQRRQLLSSQKHFNHSTNPTSQPPHRILNHPQETIVANPSGHEKSIRLSKHHPTSESTQKNPYPSTVYQTHRKHPNTTDQQSQHIFWRNRRISSPRRSRPRRSKRSYPLANLL